jgi:hypothetical protein
MLAILASPFFAIGQSPGVQSLSPCCPVKDLPSEQRDHRVKI